MRPLKPREDRRTVAVPARLRSEAGWSDVTIGNVSSRGMMLRCVAPPPQRAYIEVRHQGVCVVGQVVWISGARCGVRTQDLVDVAGLLSQGARPARQPANDRRAASRPIEASRRPSPVERAEASRRFARLFDFAVVVAAATGAAAVAATAMFDAFSAPLSRTTEALASAR
jgi:hypothetical protein